MKHLFFSLSRQNIQAKPKLWFKILTMKKGKRIIQNGKLFRNNSLIWSSNKKTLPINSVGF